MSSKKRLERALRTASTSAAGELKAEDSLVDYIKLLYELDEKDKLLARMKKEGDAS